MKTKEELNQLKEQYTELNKKLSQLSEEELVTVTEGIDLTDSAYWDNK